MSTPPRPDRVSTDFPRYSVRPALAQDVPVLWTMLELAAYWSGPPPQPPQLQQEPGLRHYVAGWEPGQPGVVAQAAAADSPVGAAWVRLWSGSQTGYGFVRDGVPELSMAVVPAWQRRGVGAALLAAVLDATATAGFPAISLSVSRANERAGRLYRRAGFTVWKRTADSDTMLLDLPVPGDLGRRATTL